ncbi:hypothetical protein NQ152_15555 [Microbacterium sp. zg.B48]|uniref:hypothetical protein n=1 Tax=Microbacterium sp. zg.B48 TaxID=2969408 RepID=UPI00214CE471|nr:hypothetical protein [Microbacterium sp. zg.B48]MCR2764926.1 hypothetical protein [Microbacterium sp. zg.B48]
MMIEIKNDVVTLDAGNDFATDVLRVVFHDLTTIKVDSIKTAHRRRHPLRLRQPLPRPLLTRGVRFAARRRAEHAPLSLLVASRTHS